MIDCNCEPTSVVGGGPTDEGANSARWADFLQRAFYNGWKSIHGLKHQTVDLLHGFTIDQKGPTSLRRNDTTVLRESKITQRLKDVQEGENEEDKVMIFGDSAYTQQEYLRSYFNIKHDDPALSEHFARWNGAMKSVRVSIEWNYGYTATLFQYLTKKNKLKVMKGKSVTKVYTVCTLLRNLHVGLYGCQSSNYFDLIIPQNFIENYLNQTDF